ncbi:MAG: GNAT family N-acetyltransferase [candidate division Zixibacteria bacterium]|nr:GNAT family N-acetyltransferase [candidate division Zixibacteria bacterium]
MPDNINEKNLKRVRFLESERLFLTPINEDDMDFHYFWDHERETQALDGGTHRPQNYENYKKEYYKDVYNNKKAMIFSIILKEDGTLIGIIVLFHISYFARTCDWGLKLDKPYRRRGIGREAARLLMEYVFEELGFVRLQSGTHHENTASIKLQESLGFVREGVFRKARLVNGEYLDSIHFAMLRDEYEKLYAQNRSR